MVDCFFEWAYFTQRVEPERKRLAQEAISWLDQLSQEQRTFREVYESLLKEQGVTQERIDNLSRLDPTKLSQEYLLGWAILNPDPLSWPLWSIELIEQAKRTPLGKMATMIKEDLFAGIIWFGISEGEGLPFFANTDFGTNEGVGFFLAWPTIYYPNALPPTRDLTILTDLFYFCKNLMSLANSPPANPEQDITLVYPKGNRVINHYGTLISLGPFPDVNELINIK